ncbi:LysR family transcriptional regulator [Solihabitans fulvus]|uniref:LysR family transcriptional regulator n=1 Tax=Solihabitans fulvus TaxID=1892852 RepID=A0A5B2XRZ9_9PSEU|nr:LysR family transcriptional regulator [Solihabitans fulvus]KAA2265740.1 LysR family transcriptional regulator [Solihabitans fulvus]
MADLEIRELRYFVALAEELSFSRAAGRLGMAQPPLSKAVQGMERKLGVILLRRSTRRVELTDAGRVLLDQARHVLDAAAAASARTRRAGLPQPRLVVAVKPGGDAGLLADVLARYHREPGHPPARVTVGGWGEQAAELREGAADVALLRDLPDHAGLDHEVLATQPRGVLLPRGHRLAGRGTLRRADLAGEPVPVWPPAGPRHALFRAALDHLPGAAAPEGPEVGDFQQLLEVVALGQGVAFVPLASAALHPRADLVCVPVVDISPSTVVVAWAQTSRSPSVAAFVRAATDAAADISGRHGS